MYSILRCNGLYAVFIASDALCSSMSNSHIQTHSRNEPHCTNVLQQTFSCYFLMRAFYSPHIEPMPIFFSFFNEMISDGKIAMKKYFNWKNSFLVKNCVQIWVYFKRKKIVKIPNEAQQCTQSQTGGWMIWCRRYVL